MRRTPSSIALVKDVVLFSADTPIGSFKTREIGYKGIRLETGKHRLEAHDFVEILLTLDSERQERFRMKGIVQRSGRGFARLILTGSYPDYFKALTRLMPTEPNRAGKKRTGALARASFCSDCPTLPACLVAGLGKEEIGRFEKIIKARSDLRRGSSVFRYGEAIRALFLIRSGSVKTWTVTEDGEAHVDRFYLPGDVIGLDALATGRYAGNATALDTCSICEIPFGAFRKLAVEIPALNERLINLLSQEVLHANRITKLRGNRSAPVRLAAFLDELSQNLDARGFSSRCLILPMGRRDIADYLGLAEETVSRTFTQLQVDGVLEVHRKYIRIRDRENLRKLCGTANRNGGAAAPREYPLFH